MTPRLPALQHFADQGQTIVTKIHVGFVNDDSRRPESAARDYLVSISSKLVLKRRFIDASEKLSRIDTHVLAGVRQHRILGDVIWDRSRYCQRIEASSRGEQVIDTS
jgi:hypothetical protein